MSAPQDWQPTGDLKVTDLRVVILDFGADQKHVTVREQDVDALVRASTRLHHRPGINPSSGMPTAKVMAIWVYPLVDRGPSWWSDPDLGRAEGVPGAIGAGAARIIDRGQGKLVWSRPNQT